MHQLFVFFLSFLFLVFCDFFTFLQQIDLRVLETINHNRIEYLDPFFIFITNIATVTTYSASVILLLYSYIKKIFLLERKSWLVFIALISTSAIIDSLKHIVNRTRPFIAHPSIHNLVNVTTASFPSGHTGEVFVFATTVTLLFAGKKWCMVVVWFWALLVAYTRLVLGVHYPSDVLASVTIGVGIGIALPKYLISRGFLQHHIPREPLDSMRKE
jgi:membrane-associated phospholipid phosphatase